MLIPALIAIGGAFAGGVLVGIAIGGPIWLRIGRWIER